MKKPKNMKVEILMFVIKPRKKTRDREKIVPLVGFELAVCQII